MKIIHCLAFYLPEKLAGTEVYAHELSKQLENLGLTVEVIIPNQVKAEWEEYTHEGILVTKYPESSERTKALIQGRILPSGIFTFKQLLQDKKPDIIHFHEITGSTGITIHHFRIAHELGIKVVFTMHLSHYTCNTGTLFFKEKIPCNGKINCYKCAYCSLIVQKQLNETEATMLAGASWTLGKLGIDLRRTQSKLGTALSYAQNIQDIKNRLQQIVQYTTKICVLTQWYKKILLDNGVPQEKIVFIPQALPAYPISTEVFPIPIGYPLKLIFIGRIFPSKGLHILLQALGKIDAEYIHLEIYGNVVDEDYYSDCKRLAEELPNVSFGGTLNRGEILQKISQAHFLCLPSTFSEMSPLVIQEAFAVGVPVIGSNVAGIQEQIQHGYNGLLFQFGVYQDLANILKIVLEDLTIIERLRKNITTPRNFSEMAEEMLQLYQSL